MANKFTVEIRESVEELQQMLERATTATSKEKLLMLYWLRCQIVKTRQELAALLKRDESTIYRWLCSYKKEGIKGLLQVKKAPGKKPHIPQEYREKLVEKLVEPTGPKSYSEIRCWLEREFGVKVSYKVVHDLVHYKLKVKLKVPRAKRIKTDEDHKNKKKYPNW